MLLFCYLRRALAGLRAGVGGPQCKQLRGLVFLLQKLGLDIFQKAIDEDSFKFLALSMGHLHEVIFQLVRFWSLAFDEISNAIMGGSKRSYEVRDILSSKAVWSFFLRHIAILSARSQRRYGPLVLGFTGGKA